MVKLGRTDSSSNHKSDSESDKMDVDPDFNESPERRSTRHSGRRMNLTDHGSRRSARMTVRKNNFYESSSESERSESDDEEDEEALEGPSTGSGETATNEDGENHDETVPLRRPIRSAAQNNSWLYMTSDSGRPRRSRRPPKHFQESGRRSLRSSGGSDLPPVNYREGTEEKEEPNKNKKDKNGVSPGDVKQEGGNEAEHANGDEGQLDDNDEYEAETHGDMYSRLKGRSARRSARVNYRELGTSRTHPKDDEPVSRRLRERKINRTEFHQESQSAIEDFCNKAKRRRNKKKRKRASSSSSSSSDSSSEPRRGNRSRQNPFEKAEKAGSKTGFMDLQPNEVDPTITFASIGGLHHVIEKLRETVILPLVYKEFYADRNITPPKGILFHGPPGTGKTMLARALVNECSTLAGQKVTFFVRKGGDLLSKWVGESERQLRKLFEEAYRCQPSIIFFDEIDGLAPVRSAKTDQVHNSVVSTLLAELDGVKDRGDVIIIGATNRIDSIDAALRRPGRFDHEFSCLLPALKDRVEILKSHTRKWKGDEVSDVILEEVAKLTVGYSGADLKLLCAEASVCALRRRYPQIYASKNKFLLNYESIKVEAGDWIQAMDKIKPSSSRTSNSILTTGEPLPPAVVPLLQEVVDTLETAILTSFPLTEGTHLMNEPAPKRFLIYARHEDSGIDQYIVPALLHCFESIPVFVLNFECSATKDCLSESAAIMRVFNEADRIKKLAIILIPSINVLFRGLSIQGQEFLHQQIMRASAKPVFILATIEPESYKTTLNGGLNVSAEEDMPDSLLMLFKGWSKLVEPISSEARTNFFKPLFTEKSVYMRVENEMKLKPTEELPLAPPPAPKKASPEELKLVEKREAKIHRRLRKFLREVLAKLARNNKFKDFLVPVDTNEVTDYLEIVKNPMCLETMMCKLDAGAYLSAKDFLQDIYLIRDNAVEYNPTTTKEGLAIRHHAYQLVDHAEIILDEEMNSDFEETCQNISDAKKKRNAEIGGMAGDTTESITPKAGSSKECSNNVGSHTNGSVDSPTQSTPGNGIGVKRKLRLGNSNATKQRKLSATMSIPDSPAPSVSPTASGSAGSSKTTRKSPIRLPLTSSFAVSALDPFKYIKGPNHEDNVKSIRKLLTLAVEATETLGVNRMLDLRYQILLMIERYYPSEEKDCLIADLKSIILDFRRIQAP